MNLNGIGATIEDISPERIKLFSGDVAPGDVFFAVRGSGLDGHDFIGEALERGASRIVCERIPPGLSTASPDRFIVYPNTREALARTVKKAFQDPASRLMTFGVTGTNGKTTTVFLIEHVLNASGIPAGSVSTVLTSVAPGLTRPSDLTTPDVIRMNSSLRDMLDNGCRAAAVELSSHALAQDRVPGLSLDAAVFTNISPEHLDYHMTMEDYFRDKCRIFRMRKPAGRSIVNIDDPFIRDELSGLTGDVITYGFGADADVRAEEAEYTLDGQSSRVHVRDRGYVDMKSGLVGGYNAYNILAVVAALVFTAGLSLEDIARSVRTFPPPPGRMQRVGAFAPFRVFVDYAHTPDALENALSGLRAAGAKRLICVTGCGGDRDRSKRPVMGRIATTLAEKVVFTSDNPRTESPEAILNEIVSGAVGGDHWVVEDRREAIARALAFAREGDVVLIAGKGHETYQQCGAVRHDFDDRVVTEEIMKGLCGRV